MLMLLSGIVFYSDELQISFVTVMQREHHKERREQITAAKKKVSGIMMPDTIEQLPKADFIIVVSFLPYLQVLQDTCQSQT